jgi:AraC-like DNA-binding protein
MLDKPARALVEVKLCWLPISPEAGDHFRGQQDDPNHLADHRAPTRLNRIITTAYCHDGVSQLHTPTAVPEKKIERICLAMPHSLMVKMDTICREMGMSRSHYMRTLIEARNDRLFDKIDQVMDAFNRQRSA